MIDPACNPASAEDAQRPDSPTEIDIQRVMQMIPHRQPFLMIDKVVGVVADARATGIKNLTINESFFQGHFPARPVMPGVLIIEAMAQTAAVLVVYTLGPQAEGKLVYFMTVDNARFRRPVFPGDVLHIHVSKQRNRGNVWKFEGRAEVRGQLMAEAVFTAMILDD
jgi:3-hydroxyacyl-[acyl-carrier-protein] dehydratase